MSLHGVDLSNNNDAHHISAAVSSRSNAFVIAKASEGEHTPDHTHDGTIAAARADGKAIGHYHFAHPSEDPIKQADFFLAEAKAKPGDLLALDQEAVEGSPSHMLWFALTWLRYVKGKTGASPAFYSYRSYIADMLAVATQAQANELRSYPLWIADPDNPAGHPATEGWSTWTIHQYGEVSNVDNDVLNGDLHTWAALAIPHPAAPKPPAPKPPVPTPTPKPPTPAPVPQKGYTMVIFGQNLDAGTASAAVDAFQPKGAVATANLAVAQAALAAGDIVIAVGGPANSAIGYKHAKPGNVVVQGKEVAVQGATAGDSYVLLGRYLATGK